MSGSMVAGAVVAVGAVVACWSLSRSAVTALHEAGHAIVAVLFRGKLSTVRVRRDTSGVTTYRAPRSRVGAAVCAAAGYPAPLMLGAAAFGAVYSGVEREFLFALVAIVVVSVPLWRGWWTAAVGVALGAGFAVAAFSAGRWATGAVSAIGAFGAVGGLRAALEAVAAPVVRGDGSDVAVVAQSFFLPVAVSRFGLLVAAVSLAAFDVWLFVLALQQV